MRLAYPNPIVCHFPGSAVVSAAPVGVSPTVPSFSPFTIHHSPFSRRLRRHLAEPTDFIFLTPFF